MSRSVMVAGKSRHLTGWKKGRPDHRDFKLTAPGPLLPTHVDLRPGCPPILDQGELGSCTANTGCEIMEFLEKKGQNDVAFSRLYIYYWTRNLEGTPATEDSGAEIRDVMKVLSQRGAPLEATWPYDVAQFSTQPPATADTEAGTHKATYYYTCPNLFTVKASLAQGFPVAFGFSVPNNMMSDACAQSGMVQYPAPDEGFDGGHAVTAVGYDDTMVIGKETGAVLCQNHWGTGWGLQGFFWLPYRFWTDGLADDCWTLRSAQV